MPRAQILGMAELRAAFKGLPTAIENRGIKNALLEVARRTAKAVKPKVKKKRTRPLGKVIKKKKGANTLVSYEGGQTQKAIGVTRVKKMGKKWFVAVGVRANMPINLGTISRGRRKGSPRIHDPFFKAQFAGVKQATEAGWAEVKDEAPKIMGESVDRAVMREMEKARK